MSSTLSKSVSKPVTRSASPVTTSFTDKQKKRINDLYTTFMQKLKKNGLQKLVNSDAAHDKKHRDHLLESPEARARFEAGLKKVSV